jgi:hypothetical protein
MSFRRRTARVLAILLLLALIALGAFWWLRRARAPESVRLLPEADAVVYFDVQTLRTLGAFSGGPVSHEPDYEEFVRATGIQFERDLDEAAFAVHAGAAPAAGSPAQAQALPPDTRFSEIFIGRFDADRARAYFARLAQGTDHYRDIDIYLIPHDGRQVKVAILGIDRVAVSNTDSREPIHRMVDRYRSGAMHASGPSVVSGYRNRVPSGSVAWAIARMGNGTGPGVPAPAVLAPLAGTTVVASVRPVFGAQLRLEDIAADREQAQRIAESGNTMLKVFQDIEATSTPAGTDQDVKDFFASIKVEQHDTSALVTATIPPGFLKKITSEPATFAPPAPAPAPTPAPPKKKR